MRGLSVFVVTAVLAAMVTESFGGSRFHRRRDPSPVSQERTLVGLCKANIGSCPTRTSRGSLTCPLFSVPCPTFQTVSINCPIWGVIEVQNVTACNCCRSKLLVQGVVVDSMNTALKLEGFTISLYGRQVASSNANGEFEAKVGPLLNTVPITVRDPSGNYISTVKVVDIPRGLRGPISVTVAMVKAATPIVIKASEDTTLSISSDPANPTAGNATILIKAGSFRNRDWSAYSGDVSISLTYINTGDLTVEDEIPGIFRTWSQPLLSDGIFAVKIRAADGSTRLRVKPVLVTVRSEMRLWFLSFSGRWWQLRNARGGRRRGRRQATTAQFSVNINDGQWINIDRIERSPTCYFKTRVFNEDGAEIVDRQTALFKPEILAYRVVEGQRLRLYLPFTTRPSGRCFEARCPTADDLLAGFISMKSYEDVLVNGTFISVVQQLRPKQLSDYSSTIQTALSSVQYDLTPDQQGVFGIFLSSETGPFYTSRAVCENADATQPAFHFIKPNLPTYIPFPGDVTECTARVYLTGNDFMDVLADYTGPPLPIAVVSTWTQSETNYTYTTSTHIQFSNTSVADMFYFGCLTYRCSQPSELTTVNVDLDVPRDAVTNKPLFVCALHGDGDEEIIDGQFPAPETVGNARPDYYNNTQNDCDQRTKFEAFAYTFKCFKERVIIGLN